MPATIEVHFKGIRKDYFRWGDEAEPLRLRDPVIVEAERGLDFGRVTALGTVAEKRCGGCSGCAAAPAEGAEPTPLRPVLRVATAEEVRAAEELRRSEDEVRRRVADRTRTHGLAMRISDAEWQWDRRKLTVFFTAEQRVDFRALVRELATQYRTRIELRQIGVRDEAARIGGVGRCGREFCCSTWLKDLSPVSLSLAKDQHLSLNPAQISGGCGRLLCCLRYEHDFYLAARKRFPKEGKTVQTARGPEKVVAVDIFRERVFLRNDEHGPRTILLTDLKAEVEGLGENLPVPAERAPRGRAAAVASPSASTTPVASPKTSAAPPAPDIPDAGPGPEGGGPRKRRRKRGRRGNRGGGGPASTPESPEG
jgi:cell fate regulator YaaT (PSP1 superfamily)